MTQNNNNALNKVFSSPYKDEIEKRLALGQSTRAVSQWLRTRGEDISHATLNKYKKEFFNIEAEVAKVVEQKQLETTQDVSLEEIEDTQKKLIETEKNRALGTIRGINHVAMLYQNIQDMRDYIETLKRYEPIVASHAARGLFQEIRATIESLEKIKANSNEADDSSVARMLSNLKKQKKEMETIAKQRRDESED